MSRFSTAVRAIGDAVATLADYTVHKLARHREAPRVFVETRKLALAGFEPGTRYSVEVDRTQLRLTLRVCDSGQYTVSRRQREGQQPTPVIDLNSNDLLGMFAGHDALRMVVMARTGVVYFLPLATAAARVERADRIRAKMQRGEPLATASICSGAGFMAYALSEGYQKGGLATQPVLINEIDAAQVEHALAFNPAIANATHTLRAPLQEVVLDPWLMDRLPKVEIAEVSLPCSGASTAGRAKRGHDGAEEHPEVGHLIAPAIMLLQRLQPAVIVVENVVPYRNSGSAWVLRHMLRDMGYNVCEAELDGADFGQLEARRRWFLVATTAGVAISLDGLVPTLVASPSVAEVLEDIGPADSRWSSYSYLFTKQSRDEAKGNGFTMQFVEASDARVPTLRKGYHKGGSTDPLLRHPTEPGRFRKFTAVEHARIKGFPESLVAGLSETRAHELLGQSVMFAPVAAIGRRIAHALRAFANGAETGQGVSYNLQHATG